MRLPRTVGILTLCVAASVAVTWALDDYRVRLDFARRPHSLGLNRADLEGAYAHVIPLLPVTEPTHFEHQLWVQAVSGEEVHLDFSRGKHIVLFAGCT
jgi:hypothetical protein